MKAERIFDLIVWFLIAAVGLGAAYVCFGILKSTASGQYQAYSVGGAIAGAIISWSILTSVYLQLRGSSNELRELRSRTEELQNKVIRGAPRPRGFDTEVDERQRIVLARPRNWEPKGGTIFELQEKEENLKKGDEFLASFRCYFVPIIKNSTPSREAFYANELNNLKAADEYVHSYSYEMVRIGAESAEIESLKVIARQFGRVRVGPTPETGRVERTVDILLRDDFTGRIDSIEPAVVSVGKPTKITLLGRGFREGAVVYINKMKRETKVLNDWSAEIILSPKDVAFEGALEVVLENQGAGEHRSKSRSLVVSAELKSKDAGEAVLSGSSASPENAPVLAPAEKVPSSQQNAEVDKKPAYVEIVRMRVVCYHEQLDKIYYLEFFDDVKDFKDSSAVFNRILASTRFLD